MGSFFMRTVKTLIRLSDAQADLSLRWVHCHFVGFDMRWLKWKTYENKVIYNMQKRLSAKDNNNWWNLSSFCMVNYWFSHQHHRQNQWRSWTYIMSQLMRLWYVSSSVNSFFERACTAIRWGYISDSWSDPSSTSILHVYEQRKLWRDCANAQAHLSLRWLPMW